jgi:hypothetical protein
MECWGMAFDEAGWGFNFFIKNMAWRPYGFCGLSFVFVDFGIFGRFFLKSA